MNMDTVTQWVGAVWKVWMASSLVLKTITGQYTRRRYTASTTTDASQKDYRCSYFYTYYDYNYGAESYQEEYLACYRPDEICCGSYVNRDCCLQSDDGYDDSSSTGYIAGVIGGLILFIGIFLCICSNIRKDTATPPTSNTNQTQHTPRQLRNPILIGDNTESGMDPTHGDHPPPAGWISTSMPPPSYADTGGTSNQTCGSIASASQVDSPTGNMPTPSNQTHRAIGNAPPVGTAAINIADPSNQTHMPVTTPPPSYDECMAFDMMCPMVMVSDSGHVANNDDRTLENESSDRVSNDDTTTTRF